MITLITGAAGFTGRNLSRYLNNRANLILTDCIPLPSGVVCDLSDASQVHELIEKTKPDQIYHLVGGYTNIYARDYLTNVQSTINVFDAALKLKLSPRIFLVGSAAEYGAVENVNIPVHENHPLKPVSIYGMMKVFQTFLMSYYHRQFNMNIVMARPFNLFGRGMSPQLFIGRIYEQITLYKAGKISSITLGNLESLRDYVGIDKAMEYYEVIMNHGTAGEIYNAGSGFTQKISDILKNILETEGLTMEIIRCAPLELKKPDVQGFAADISKLKSLLSIAENLKNEK